MFKTKLPSSRLALTFVFDLPSPNKWAEETPSSEAHERACREAAVKTGLVAADSVRAKAVCMKGVSVSTVHHHQFDPDFHVCDGGPAARFEFFYDLSAAKMAMRVVTSLGEAKGQCIDGVVATRLGLHAMEILEGHPPNLASPVARAGGVPPFKMGLRHHLRFMHEVLPGTLIRVLLAYVSIFFDWLLGIQPPADSSDVNDIKSLFRFYKSAHADKRSSYQIYRADDIEKPFRVFLATIELWRRARQLVGYFYLVNFSPLLAGGCTTNIQDICDVKKRYAGIFDPPGVPPAPPLWVIGNPQQSRRIFINNYGIHQHAFSAKPVAFLWDWLELAAPLHGAGCISINGTFMCWMRGMPSALAMHSMANHFGTPVEETTQNSSWFDTMGKPASLRSRSRS